MGYVEAMSAKEEDMSVEGEGAEGEEGGDMEVERREV